MKRAFSIIFISLIVTFPIYNQGSVCISQLSAIETASGTINYGQSFIPLNCSGNCLSAISVYGQSNSNDPMVNSGLVLEIRQGDGTGGNLIYSQGDVNISPGVYTILLDNPPKLQNGQVHTFVLVSPGGGVIISLHDDDVNSYPNGSAYLDSSPIGFDTYFEIITDDCPDEIPTLSQWGIILLGLLLLISASLAMQKIGLAEHIYSK